MATRGHVVDIAAASCSYTEHSEGRGTELRHVSGSGELCPLTEADGWDSAPDGKLFRGYVIEFEAYDHLVASR